MCPTRAHLQGDRRGSGVVSSELPGAPPQASLWCLRPKYAWVPFLAPSSQGSRAPSTGDERQICFPP